MRDLTDDVARKREVACGRYPGEPPDIAVMRLEYFQDNGWELDLDNPVDIASKLHWLKAFYRDERYPVMADKLAARDIVRQAAGDAYLSELHWSGARLPAAPPAGLPARFMLKANHGWNMNSPVDLDHVDWSELRCTTDAWLAMRHELRHGEWAYSGVPPRLLAEELLEPADGELLDYKLYCFHGEPAFFRVDAVRECGRVQRHCDLRWQPLPFTIRQYPQLALHELSQPANWEEMIWLARRLAADVPFVRVDLYNIESRIVFGELTLYPQGGNLRFDPYEYSVWAGGLLTLPDIGAVART